MTTCNVIPTVSATRHYRPLAITLLTAALAVSLAALLVADLPVLAQRLADMGAAAPVGPAVLSMGDSSVPAARFAVDQPVDEVGATF
jgi:hypothetical protein